MNQQLADRLRFLRAFAANPRQVGAILPTSRLAVRDMLDLGDVPGAGLVVELGAGTGSQTGEILARMGPDARLVALEIDPRLARLLEERFDDPRLQVVCDSAENLRDHLEGEQADVLVCALPFTSLEPGLRRRILESLPGRARPARRGAGHPVLAADPVGAAPAVPVGPPADLAAERAAGVPVRLPPATPDRRLQPRTPAVTDGWSADAVRGSGVPDPCALSASRRGAAVAEARQGAVPRTAHARAVRWMEPSSSEGQPLPQASRGARCAARRRGTWRTPGAGPVPPRNGDQ